jgi:hypothetical protein
MSDAAGKDDAGESTYVQPDLTLFGAEHIRQYRETDGEVGYLWNGATLPDPHHDGSEVG